MKKHLRVFVITLMALSLGIVATGNVLSQENFARFRTVGYYLSYSIYLEPDPYLVTEIPINELTHLVYSYAGISAQGQCESLDEWADEGFRYPGDTNERLRGNFKQLLALKEANPQLRLLLGLGGWEDSNRFSEVARDDDRVRFVTSCMTYMRQESLFDGFMIDWRYPVSGGRVDGAPDDTDNYVKLLADFRGQLDYWETQDNRRYTLAITVPPFPDLMENFPLDRIPEFIDFMDLLTYSYEGPWSDITAHHSPLFVNSRDPRNQEIQEIFTIDGAVQSFLDVGVPASQIVVGTPLYGHVWDGVQPNEFFGIFAEHGGVPGNIRPGGQLYWKDLVQFENSANYIRFFDREAGVPWLWNEDAQIAISYENQESVRNKAAYVRNQGLGGMSLWQLSYDDGRHTLTTTINEALNGTP